MASDSIYPTLPELSSGEDYRLKRIADVQTSIELELGHYEQVLKKYKRAHSGLSQCSLFCGGCTVVLSGGSLASAMTGFGIVAGAPLAGIVGGCAVVARRFERKISKHERTVELAKGKLNTLVGLISKALNDGRVSQEEFSLIVAELDKFRQLKAEIRAKSVVSLKQQTPPQEARAQALQLGETSAEIEKRVRFEFF